MDKLDAVHDMYIITPLSWNRGNDRVLPVVDTPWFYQPLEIPPGRNHRRVLGWSWAIRQTVVDTDFPVIITSDH